MKFLTRFFVILLCCVSSDLFSVQHNLSLQDQVTLLVGSNVHKNKSNDKKSTSFEKVFKVFCIVAAAGGLAYRFVPMFNSYSAVQKDGIVFTPHSAAMSATLVGILSGLTGSIITYKILRAKNSDYDDYELDEDYEVSFPWGLFLISGGTGIVIGVVSGIFSHELLFKELVNDVDNKKENELFRVLGRMGRVIESADTLARTIND